MFPLLLLSVFQRVASTVMPLIYDQATFRHPVYDLAALQAQQNIAAQNGKNHTWFCGAWMKNGFHEDGLSSALDVATAIEEQTALRVAAE